MKISMLVASSCGEAKRLVDWVENGVYHALKKGYLKTVQFGVCNDDEGLDLVEVSAHFLQSVLGIGFQRSAKLCSN